MSVDTFMQVVPGAIFLSGDNRVEIQHLLDLETVLARDLATNKLERVQISGLKRDPGSSETPVPPMTGAEDHSKDEWEIAQERLKVIRPLLDVQFRTRDQVELAAKAAGVGAVTVYAWMKLYQDTGRLSALIPRKRGRRQGTEILDEVRSAIVHSAIEEVFLNLQNRRPQEVIRFVNEKCHAAKLKSPHANTIRRRLANLPARMVLRRRGQSDVVRNKLDPIRGSFPGADFPLAVVQIDHTEADIIVVDNRTRQPIGRPWLTLAIDVYSRMVVGIYVDMHEPSAMSVGMCLSMAMLEKTTYLAELDVPGEWPVYGKMRKVHADNAREFRGSMLTRACEDNAIGIEWRKVATPEYGGHIESLMSTTAKEIRNLPGATFSNPKERGKYDSEANAALTLREFEQHIVDWIINVYHCRKHSGIGMPPRQRFQQGVFGDGGKIKGVGLPDIPSDPARLRLEFMPFLERTVQRYGVEIDKIWYYDEVLNPWIDSKDKKESSKKRKFTIRRDPGNIAWVWFFDPEVKEYFQIPYRNISHPAISLWELKQANAAATKEGNGQVDEDAIFTSVVRQRQRVENAKKQTKATRRFQHRIDRVRKAATSGRLPAASRPQEGPTASLPTASLPMDNSAKGRDVRPASMTAPEPDDIFSEPVEPFA